MKDSWVKDVERQVASKEIHDMTRAFHRNNPDYLNKDARFVLGDSKADTLDMRGIYFRDNSSTGSAKK